MLQIDLNAQIYVTETVANEAQNVYSVPNSDIIRQVCKALVTCVPSFHPFEWYHQHSSSNICTMFP
jgi:hypothetical protein